MITITPNIENGYRVVGYFIRLGFQQPRVWVATREAAIRVINGVPFDL